MIGSRKPDAQWLAESPPQISKVPGHLNSVTHSSPDPDQAQEWLWSPRE